MRRAVVCLLFVSCFGGIVALSGRASALEGPKETVTKINALLARTCANQPTLALLAGGEILRKDANGHTMTFTFQDLSDDILIDYDAEAHVILSCKNGKRCVRHGGTDADESALVVFSLQPESAGDELVKLVKELASTVAAKEKGLSAGAVSGVKVQFTDTKLKNGLRVIIAEDHTAPVFAIAVTYNVGSRNERPGRTGFAHLFEHMMFKGSENVGSGEHFLLVYNNGGSMNGSTNKDRTNYFEALPTNQFDLALFLESDRMRTLAKGITKENLKNQIDTVQEERREVVDNQAYGRTNELLEDLAYVNPNYKHSVIGSMADLSAATVEDVQAFFTTYYAPNNAVVAVVGDVKPAECLAKMRQYFESIPPQTPPPEPDMTEPPQAQEKRLVLDDRLARATRLDMVYHIPNGSDPDYDALDVLGTILSSGRASRFYETIVRQKQLATSVSGGAQEMRGPGLFRVEATLAPGKSVAGLEAAVSEEIDRLKTGTIEAWEIEKARNIARSQMVARLGSSLYRAVLLSQYAVFYNDPGLVNTRADRRMRVTAADVQRVAKKYLVPENRTAVITNPAPAAAGQKGGL